MDFDLNLDLGGSKGEPAKPAEAPIDLGGLSLDLGTPGGGGGGSTDAKWQEVATKLEVVWRVRKNKVHRSRGELAEYFHTVAREDLVNG